MTDSPKRFMGGFRLPDDAPAQMTLVDLTWRQGRIEHWIRFGRYSYECILARDRRIVGFAPESIFAFVRWAANDYGTVISRIDILRAVRPDDAHQTLPFVRPGGEILLKAQGWSKVERVLQAIDAIEALGIAPHEVAPEHWRHVHNRLTVGASPRRYSRAQHHAWLKRRRILS